MRGIVDTGYLVALLRREDEHHRWAKGLAAQLKVPLLTCEAVLAEAAFHLASSAYVLEMLERGVIRIIQQVNDVTCEEAGFDKVHRPIIATIKVITDNFGRAL